MCSYSAGGGRDARGKRIGTWTVVRRDEKLLVERSGEVPQRSDVSRQQPPTKGASPRQHVHGKMAACPMREQTRSIKDCRTVGELQSLVCDSCVDFNAIHVSTAFHRLAALNKAGDLYTDGQLTQDRTEAIQLLENRAVALVEDFQAQGVANTIWALATIGEAPSQELLELLDARAEAVASDLSAQGVANILWAFAKMGWGPSEQTLRALESRAEELVEGFKPQEVANTLWALATMGRGIEATLWRAMAAQTVKIAGSFKAQEVASALWALATMGLAPGDRVLGAVERRVREVSGDFTSQGVANTLWALAAVGREPGRSVLTAVERRAEEVSRHFKPQEIANTLWAYATWGLKPGEGLLWALERRTEETAHEFNAQDVANALWAFSVLGVVPGEGVDVALERRGEEMKEVAGGEGASRSVANTIRFRSWAFAMIGAAPGRKVGVLEERAKEVAAQMKAQEVANTLWALAKMGRRPEAELVLALEERAAQVAGAMKAQEIANMLWAYATMAMVPGEWLVDAVEERTRQGGGSEFSAQGVGNMLWAVSFLVMRAPGLARRITGALAPRALALAGDGAYDVRSMGQLHQFLLTCRVEEEMSAVRAGSGLAASVSALNASLATACHASFVAQPTRPSASQQQLSKALRSMGLRVRDEYRCPMSGYSIDMFVTRSGSGSGRADGSGGLDGWAVEFDGPYHFLSSKEPTGATLIKWRHLERFGYPLVSVPYWDWYRLQAGEGTQRATEKLLRAALRAAASSKE
jgi:hypothetical protein